MKTVWEWYWNGIGIVSEWDRNGMGMVWEWYWKDMGWYEMVWECWGCSVLAVVAVAAAALVLVVCGKEAAQDRKQRKGAVAPFLWWAEKKSVLGSFHGCEPPRTDCFLVVPETTPGLLPLFLVFTQSKPAQTTWQ